MSSQTKFVILNYILANFDMYFVIKNYDSFVRTQTIAGDSFVRTQTKAKACEDTNDGGGERRMLEREGSWGIK